MVDDPLDDDPLDGGLDDGVEAVVWAELELPEAPVPVLAAPETSVPMPSPRPRHPAVTPPATTIFLKRSLMTFLLW